MLVDHYADRDWSLIGNVSGGAAVSGDNGIGRGRVPGEVRAERDVYLAGRDLVVAATLSAATDPAASFDARVVLAAEELAAAVAEQWRREEGLRRIQDPVPVPVRWTAADPLLSDHTANICRVPDDSIELDGTLNEVVEAFTAIPSRRLVVIGQPGAGKTVFALRLTLDLLARRPPGEPVPVVMGLHTWNPVEQSLQDWMAWRLVADYPVLRTADRSGRTIASELVRKRLIVPVLDGLDEVGHPLRGEAIRALNMSLDRGAPIIVTCREADYRQLVTDADVLTSAAVIELLPVELDELAGYLPRTTRRILSQTAPGFATKWDHILERLQNDRDDPACRTLLEVLRTPLMTSLARSVYSDTTADPAFLLDGGLAGCGEVEAHLLDDFIPAAFATRQRHGWPAADAERWLGFLAVHLDRSGTRDLEWWRLETAIPAPARWLAPGVAAWLSIGAVFGTIAGSAWAWLYGASAAAGLTAGLASAAAGGLRSIRGRPARDRLMLRRLCFIGLAGVPVGVISALTATGADPLGGSGSSTQDQILGISFVLLGGFAVGVVLGSVGIDVQRAPSTTPLHLPRRFRALSRRVPHAIWRALLNGGVIGAGLLLALGLGYAAALIPRIEEASVFPVGGSAVTRLADGSSYVDYPDGLRFNLSPAGSRSIATTGRIPFYMGYADGTPYANFFGDKPDCLAEFTVCRIHAAEMFEFSTVDGSGMSATVLNNTDPLSPYSMEPFSDTGLDADITDWLTPISLSNISEWIGQIAPYVLILLIAASLIGGLLLWLSFPSDIAHAISPKSTLRTDRSAAIFRGIALSLLVMATCIIFAAATGSTAKIGFNPTSAWVAVCSVGIGLLAFTLSTWFRFQVARAWLTIRGRLPSRLMSFLEEAHSRGVLRQAGAAYQFRHIRLQEHLVTRAQTSKRSPATASLHP